MLYLIFSRKLFARVDVMMSNTSSLFYKQRELSSIQGVALQHHRFYAQGQPGELRISDPIETLKRDLVSTFLKTNCEYIYSAAKPTI